MEKPNQSYINSLSAGDESFKQQLISIIKKEFPEEKQAYFKNYNAKKYTLAASNVHKLKHKISILGLETSYEIAVNHENQLLKGRTLIHQQFDAILINITNYLITL